MGNTNEMGAVTMKQQTAGEISIVQMSLLIVTGIGLKDHVTIIPALIQSAGRDGWLSIIISFIITCIWGLLLIYIYNGMGQGNLFEWLDQTIKKWPTQILKLIISLYFVFLAAGTAKEMIVWTKVTYLLTTPAFFLILMYIILCVFMASTSLQTLAMVNVLLLTIILILGFFVGFSNMQFKDFSLLKPVLEHGIAPVFSGALYTLSGMVELIMLLFLAHRIHDVIRYKAVVINAFLLLFLTMGPFVGAITEFGPGEASKQIFPAYAEWSIISLGRFIEHMDFFSIYQWLSGSFIRVSLLMYISAEVYQIKKTKKKVILLSFYGLLIVIFVLLPMNDIDFHAMAKRLLIPLTTWFFFILSVVFGCIVFVANRKKKGNGPKKARKKSAKGPKITAHRKLVRRPPYSK